MRELVRAESFDRSTASALLHPLKGLDELERLLRMPRFQIPALRSEDLEELPREFYYGRLSWGLALRSRLAAENGPRAG